MRNTTITSSFASTVITNVIHRVASVGKAVRTYLHHTSMRGPMGYWLERYQSVIADGWDQNDRQPLGNCQPGSKPGLLPTFGNSALVLCPAPAAIAAVRASRRA